MFRRMYALRFDRPAGNGRNKACFIECADMSGQRTDVIVKFTGCESGPTGLIREAMAAFFAADLEMPIPAPVLVEIPAAFGAGSTYPEYDKLISQSSRFAFGSTALPAGYTIYSPALPLKGPLVQRAADIFAFDTFIVNPDRHPKNPNCLMKGDNLIVIDHDLAFLLDTLFWKEPWILGGGSALASPERHIFWENIKNQKIDYIKLQVALKAISDSRLDEYVSALPVDWHTGNETAKNTVNYLRKLRDNADSAFSEIQRVLQ